MNNEELFLNEQMPKHNPFRVPEGYFDDFASQVMASLPERAAVKPRAKIVALRAWMYAAACLLVAVFTVTLFFSRSTTADEPQSQPEVAAVTDTYIDEVADYVMMDNAEIYACLADY